MSLKPVLARLANAERLAESEAEHAFGIIMAGEATPSQIAGLLMAMRVRGETVAEMTGAVRAMRARMVAVEAPEGAIDIVGTGGDAAGRWRSTATARCRRSRERRMRFPPSASRSTCRSTACPPCSPRPASAS